MIQIAADLQKRSGATGIRTPDLLHAISERDIQLGLRDVGNTTSGVHDSPVLPRLVGVKSGCQPGDAKSDAERLAQTVGSRALITLRGGRVRQSGSD
jgi:hypothetical protein